jgi:hypothetical protein
VELPVYAKRETIDGGHLWQFSTTKTIKWLSAEKAEEKVVTHHRTGPSEDLFIFSKEEAT